MATATTSRYAQYASQWDSRGSMPSHHQQRSEPIVIPARSTPRANSVVSSSNSSSSRYAPAPVQHQSSYSRRNSNIIHPASPSTYTSFPEASSPLTSPLSPRFYTSSSSATHNSKYNSQSSSSRRLSTTYSSSPKYAAAPSPPSSLKDSARRSSPTPSTKSSNSRRRSVSFATAPITIPQSPGRERFEKKYNVECLESAKSLIDALNGAVIVPSPSSLAKSKRDSGSYSPPKRTSCEFKDLPLKHGMTALPRNLVGREAVEELGYPCEIDSRNITVFKALSKEQIDCLIALTEQLRKKESKKSSKQTVVVLEAPNHKGEKHHFSPRRSNTCTTSHAGGCTAACFPVEAACACADCK